MPTKPAESERVRELERALRDEQEHGDQLRAELDQLVEAQSDLEESRERYANLYDSAPVADLTLDQTGTIREANLEAAELLGCERRKLIGVPLSRFVQEEDRRVLAQGIARASKMPLARELRLKSHNGVALSVQAIARWTAEPRPALRVLLFDSRELDHDGLEHQRLVEAELVARQANAAKDDFIAALSHELRTPLTPVLAAVSALSSGEIAGEQLASSYELIRRNVLAEARLIDDLLDVTRITRGKLRLDLESADVHQIVQEALATLSERVETKHLELVVALDARNHFTRGDPSRLRQVFWNLLGNALKFTPEGGRIEIRSWDHDREIAIEVSDSGDGIDSTTLERIFAPFEQGERHTQASTGGLGLGLAICKGVVELHGGKIVASSLGPGKGSRFVVELSTIPEPTETPPPPEPDTQTALELPKPRIFLIEDDPDTSEALVLSLESAGYDVQTASSAEQALATDLADVDLVVSDIGLPDMTGQELLRELHKKRKVRAIALSGYGTERDIRASRSAGFVAHLTKPIELDSLIAAIQKAMLAR